MSATAASPEFPTRFVIATFVGAAIVGALILYFGLHGQLGTSIP